MKRKLISILLGVICVVNLQGQNRWNLEDDGSIIWKVTKGEAHSDNIEMSGRFISVITTYGVDEKGKLLGTKQLVFPMLRTIPNDTHASLSYTFGQEAEPVIKINNRPANEIITGFRPIGLSSFSVTPQLPETWNEMSLKNIKAFNGKSVDLNVVRSESKIRLEVSVDGKQYKVIVLENGSRAEIKITN